MKRFALVLVFAAVLMPGRAEADGLVAPFFGVNFDGSTPADTKPKTYGISMGSMGGGIFGFETELSVSPDFFGESDGVNQFNVMSTEMLREAQKHPEQYRGLVIRVCGYSALFVGLSPEVQEDIIARVEYS